MRFHWVRIKRGEVSLDRAARIASFLREQPKWQSTGTRYTDNPLQHYLWREENQATSWADFCTEWGGGTYIKADRKHLVMPGELFLVDAVLGQLWICFIDSKGKLNKVACVSENMNADYGNCFNGYALLPEGV